MAHIDFYLSTLSPYTYLAGPEFDRIIARHGAGVTCKPLDIMALFARTGGVAPKDRHPARMEYRAQDLLRRAKRLGMDFNLKPAHWPTNAAPSSYAIIAAQNAVQKGADGDLAGLVNGILRACWAEEKDIAEDSVVRDCLGAAGFDQGLAHSGLLEGAETYGRNLEEAVAAGAFGSPFYITDDGARFWGEDRLADLNAHLAGTVQMEEA